MRPARALPLEAEAADAVAGKARQVVVAAIQGEANQVDEPFGATGQMTPQAQQPLPVLAEGVQADRDGATVRPEDLVALELDVAVGTVSGRVTTEQDGQGTSHP